MLDPLILLVIVVILALAFDFINGFHDTANAIATSVSTHVLSPRAAIGMSAILNVVGAVSGTAVAKTIGSGIVAPTSVTQVTVIAGLLAAIIWNLITWYYAIPSSSSHAIIGGVIGASLVTAGTGALLWDGILKIFVILIASPVVGFVFSGALMTGLLWLFHRSSPASVANLFRFLQIGSAAFMGFSHGTNDAQKTMGIITLALVSYHGWTTFEVPLWVILLSALAMGLGTAVGGWRIIRTMGTKIVQLRPIHGFAAETSAAIVIETASRLGFPLSTTHVISSTIMGVGASKRLSAVRWGVAWNILAAWIITIPACIGMAFVFAEILHFVIG
ncbi:MAG: inorganic phosphate transporter [Dehalococcoidia bacterium]|nr:inorganic phosphate transporter [Dehalococcoidia bacterium]